MTVYISYHPPLLLNPDRWRRAACPQSFARAFALVLAGSGTGWDSSETGILDVCGHSSSSLKVM
jgi:hypothetical protein